MRFIVRLPMPSARLERLSRKLTLLKKSFLTSSKSAKATSLAISNDPNSFIYSRTLSWERVGKVALRSAAILPM
jgi:uncharacterized protein (UPF0147 family)